MDRQRNKPVVWSWETISAFCCFAGGILAALIGSVLTAITWILGAAPHPWVRGFGTGLLIVTIPLLILAGYCLDWSERPPKKQSDRSPKDKESGIISLVGVFTVAVFLIVVLTAPLELRPQRQFSKKAKTTKRLQASGGKRSVKQEGKQ